MGNKHVYLEYDVMDNENQWIRSFNHRDGFGSTQYLTRCGRLWEAMQIRCYNELYLSKFPTYSGCTNAFSSFQEFVEWARGEVGYIATDKYGKFWCLDKDILVKGNKVYSGDTCCFVPETINVLFSTKRNGKSNLPMGVTKDNSKFRARCHTSSGRLDLGVYKTPEEAHKAWQTTKVKHIRDVAEEYLVYYKGREDVYVSILSRAESIEQEIKDGIITTLI